ncbi:flagellar export protein FliJ [Aliikangiella maris]|uniref:Flagellar export protein FliJ n=2 Tax=Aliikangiella maris TaxID=3162458 RepID=A0ABV3MPG6_9GAMM
MVRSKRLKPIQEMAQNKEKAAAKEMGESLHNRQLQEQKLEQLKTYRQEYLFEMEQQTKIGVSGSRLQQYHQFLAKLDLAISQQKETIERCNQQLDASKGRWTNQRNKTKTITQVMQKLQHKEMQNQNKKEANRIDEMSTQAFIRQHAK